MHIYTHILINIFISHKRYILTIRLNVCKNSSQRSMQYTLLYIMNAPYLFTVRGCTFSPCFFSMVVTPWILESVLFS